MQKRLISFRELKAICPNLAQANICFQPNAPGGFLSDRECHAKGCPRWANLKTPKPTPRQGRQDTGIDSFPESAGVRTDEYGVRWVRLVRTLGRPK